MTERSASYRIRPNVLMVDFMPALRLCPDPVDYQALVPMQGQVIEFPVDRARAAAEAKVDPDASEPEL